MICYLSDLIAGAFECLARIAARPVGEQAEAQARRVQEQYPHVDACRVFRIGALAKEETLKVIPRPGLPPGMPPAAEPGAEADPEQPYLGATRLSQCRGHPRCRLFRGREDVHDLQTPERVTSYCPGPKVMCAQFGCQFGEPFFEGVFTRA